MSDVILYAIFLICTVVIIVLARIKNRTWWLWGLAAWIFLPFPGGTRYAPVLFVIILIAVVFISPVCPQCRLPLSRKDLKEGVCPTCGACDGETRSQNT
jgi:hypothetical protein